MLNKKHKKELYNIVLANVVIYSAIVLVAYFFSGSLQSAYAMGILMVISIVYFGAIKYVQIRREYTFESKKEDGMINSEKENLTKNN